jgi:hypothetical protein
MSSPFHTRGVVLTPEDLIGYPWPEKVREAGLTTIGTHVTPRQVLAFVESEPGREFLERCRSLGIRIEHELHAMSDLLPRELFAKNPEMFPMNEDGDRIRDHNLCVSSKDALEIICVNAARYARLLPSDTSRYFFWTDDGSPMCRCPRCIELSDSDQALLLENAMLDALRAVDPVATLAHLAYLRTMAPPTQIRPQAGIFLEFAPIERRHDLALEDDSEPSHQRLLEALDANLEVFGAEGAQALEYWLDVSRFAGWNRERIIPIPWNSEIFGADVETYRKRGIAHITTFAVWADGRYAENFGDPPLKEYGEGFREA